MQNTPISPAERVRLSKQFDELTGGTKPKDIAEALKYELAKEKFIKEQVLQKMRQNPAMADLLSKGSLMPPSAPQAQTMGNSDVFAGAANTPPAKPPLEQLLEAARQAQAQPKQNSALPWQQQSSLMSSPITGQPSIAGALLKDRFQSTPLPPQTPPAPAAAPQATGMPAPAQKPPVMPPQQGSAGMSASMSMGGGGGAAVNPAMNSAYLKQIQAMVEKQLVGPQRDAAEAQLETMKRAQAEYNAATGGGESALDFYRKSMEGIKRPDRKDAQLSDEDRNDMLMRFGLGMLKNNRKGFGEALGAAGTDAIDFGDRAKERQFTDALEVYRDAMTRLNTEVNLSQKDKDALRERATTSYNQAKEIAGAEAAVALSGTAGAKTNIDAINEAYKEANANARNAQNNATSRANASLAVQAAAAKAVPTNGLNAEGYARLSKAATARAQELMKEIPKKDDPNYNAYMEEINRLKGEGAFYWDASKRAAGGR